MNLTFETIMGQVVAKANHYLAVPGKNGERRIIKDQAVRNYETSFAIQCRLYRDRMINQPFVFHLKVYYRDNNHDLDNSIKTILDCLQYCRAISNDNLMMRVIAEKHISKDPRIEYAIEPIQKSLFDQ